MKLPTEFKLNYPLRNLTTFGIGGSARYFVEAHHVDTLKEAISFCKVHALPYFVLGKGSNVLFDDQGFDGLVIANRLNFLNHPAPDLWQVAAGYSFSLLGTQSARKDWTGLEFASGIPGSVGGAVYMNAGANGQETADTLQSVDFLTEDSNFCTFERTDLHFSYRQSSFQSMPGIIIAATFRLQQSPQARSKQINLIRYRQDTQPYGDKSAGCVFRNPLPHSAGQLIEQMGLKGLTIGGAQVSPMHANFIVNLGHATAQDVLTLAALVQEKIKEKTGIDLENEVRYIPYRP